MGSLYDLAERANLVLKKCVLLQRPSHSCHIMWPAYLRLHLSASTDPSHVAAAHAHLDMAHAAACRCTLDATGQIATCRPHHDCSSCPLQCGHDRYEKYDGDAKKAKNGKNQDAFTDECEELEAEIHKLMAIAAEVASEGNRAAVAAKNAEIRWEAYVAWGCMGTWHTCGVHGRMRGMHGYMARAWGAWAHATGYVP